MGLNQDMKKMVSVACLGWQLIIDPDETGTCVVLFIRETKYISYVGSNW